ncbi:substrate-binding protein [Hahella sp. SMD15-11]|uniref:Substrate-binding protein n=1 Tax=Thermohahella caldifontis TaxID=3142973 RepID=A0AB39UWR6_9GAMM
MILRVLCLVCLFVAPLVSAGTITLGLNYPQTGRYAEQGREQHCAAQMAVDEINASGGILGQTVRLATRDSRSRPDIAVANVRELIVKEQAVMLFGGASSAVAIAAGKEAARHDRLYFGTLTYSNATTGAEGHRYMFRETYNAWMAARVLAKTLNSQYAGQRYFYLTADYTWGWSTEASLRRFTGTTDLQLNPGVKTPFPGARLTHFRDALKAAEASGAQVLVLVLFGDDMVRALTLAHQMGLKNKMAVVVPCLELGMAQKAGAGIMEGVIGAVPWSWQVPYQYDYPAGRKFVEAFSGRYKKRPSSSAASAYTIVYEYKDAVERAGTFDTARVIAELEGHRYRRLKDDQYWRAFDHQSVQTVYAVCGKPWQQVLQDPYRADYFELIDSLAGEEAAGTQEERTEARKAAGKPSRL